MKKIIFFKFVVILYSLNLASMETNDSLDHQLREKVSHNNQNKVKKLLEEKADVNAFDTNGSNPLIIALRGDMTEMVKLLLDYKADPCAECNKFITRDFCYYLGQKEMFGVNKYFYPLIEAAKSANSEFLKMLVVDYKADIFLIDKNLDRLFFDYLVEQDRVESAKMTLEYAQKIDLENFSNLSVSEYTKSLPKSDYKKWFCAFMTNLLLIKKHYQESAFSKIPKPVFFMIIKLSLDPYYPLIRKLLEEKRIKNPFSENNVFSLAKTEKMKKMLLIYKKLLNSSLNSSNDEKSSQGYYCIIS